MNDDRGGVAGPRPRGVAGELRRLGARPNLAAGVRAAVATVGPALATHAAGIAGGWAGLAGFLTAVADKGGAYATRARTMGALSAAATVAAVLGAAASGHPRFSIPLVFLWATAGAFLRGWGAAAGSVGLSSTVAFVVSLSAPAADPRDAALRGGLMLGGSTVAVALSLFLWPIRAYRPARAAVAGAWRAVAEYASAAAAGAPRDFAGFRAAMEAARETLAATRRGRPGESGRGERLLMLAETADGTFAAATALAGALDGLSADDPEAGRGRAALESLAALARELADAVQRERAPAPPAWPGAADGDAWIGALAAGVRHEATRAWAAAAGVESGRRVVLPGEKAETAAQPVLQVIRENLTFRSMVFRHALRVGATCAAATGLAHALGVQRGYWVTLTALIVLQPSAGATWVRGVQRIAGTVAGGIVAAGVIAVVHDPLLLLAVIFVLATAAVSMLQVNYGVYSALLTPTFVLLADASAPDRHLPGIRIVNTLVGGALALLAARFLWPAPERYAFRGRLAAAVRAMGGYLGTAARVHAGAATRAEADAARRETGVAILNAEESLQLVLWEGKTDGTAERGMAALSYLRRIGEAANALAYTPPRRLATPDEAVLLALDGLAGRVEAGGLDDVTHALADIEQKVSRRAAETQRTD